MFCFHFGVFISEKWDDSILDLLHEIVVDQTFTVTITETHDDTEQDATYLGKLKTKTGIDVGQVLVNNGFAIAKSSTSQM